MHDVTSLVETYLSAERELAAAVESAGGSVPCSMVAQSPWGALSSMRRWANVASGHG
jgi:hypothetical protein